MSVSQPVIVIAAGGTGGHVFPGLAVAECLRSSKINIVWFGTKDGIESQRVPGMGYRFECLNIKGVRRKSIVSWLLLPWRLTFALWRAGVLLLKYRPKLVLGMGGYVSGPTGLAAYVLSIPMVIHEQNAVAGLTNRCLAKLSRCVLLGYPNALSGGDARCVGNPVRASMRDVPSPRERLAGRDGFLRLLIVGGSRGAAALNKVLPSALASVKSEAKPQVWHQSGVSDEETVGREYRKVGTSARVDAFIDDMTEALCWADLVVCRAGAQTLAEIAAVGVASILVPFPYATDNHQTKNADYFSQAGAAVLLPQSELSPAKLAGLIEEIATSRAQLIDMATHARKLAMPHASEEIASVCRAEMAA